MGVDLGRVGHGGEVVARLPGQVRPQDRQQDEGRDGPGSAAPGAPCSWVRDGVERRTQHQENGRVLGQEGQAEGRAQPRGDPTPARRSLFLEQGDVGPQRQRQEQHQGGVGGDEQGGDLHRRHQAIERRRQQARRRSVEPSPRWVDGQHGPGVNQRR